MSVYRLQAGLPQLRQVHLANDGRGGGGADRTLANPALSRTNPGNVKDDVHAHPLDSVNISEIRGFFQSLPSQMPTYSDRDLALLAKRLVVRASRVPWGEYPELSGEYGYAESWEREVPPVAAMHFGKAVTAISNVSLVVEVSRFLENDCDGVDNKSALLMMFGSCIAALPQERHVSTIRVLLSAMMRHHELRDAEKLPGRLAKMHAVRAAITALPPDQFGEVYRSLRGIQNEMRTGGRFILGINDLYFAK